MNAEDTQRTDLMAELMQQVEEEKKLALALQELAGEWVAVRGHVVVASAATLADLLEQIEPDSVDGVFQVAEQGTACFF